jgi:hypothetical protein
MALRFSQVPGQLGPPSRVFAFRAFAIVFYGAANSHCKAAIGAYAKPVFQAIK